MGHYHHPYYSTKAITLDCSNHHGRLSLPPWRHVTQLIVGFYNCLFTPFSLNMIVAFVGQHFLVLCHPRLYLAISLVVPLHSSMVRHAHHSQLPPTVVTKITLVHVTTTLGFLALRHGHFPHRPSPRVALDQHIAMLWCGKISRGNASNLKNIKDWRIEQKYNKDMRKYELQITKNI